MNSAAKAAKARTANLLGTLAGAVEDRLAARPKGHHNETDSSLAALNLLSELQGCTNLQLSQAMKLSHTAMVRLIDRLESAGLVERRAGSDRRTVNLWLTPSGQARVREAALERGATLLDIVGRLSEPQQRQLDRIAETLLRAMTTGDAEATYLCRLCDDRACPPDRCPVHQEALSKEARPKSPGSPG